MRLTPRHPWPLTPRRPGHGQPRQRRGRCAGIRCRPSCIVNVLLVCEAPGTAPRDRAAKKRASGDWDDEQRADRERMQTVFARTWKQQGTMWQGACSQFSYCRVSQQRELCLSRGLAVRGGAGPRVQGQGLGQERTARRVKRACIGLCTPKMKRCTFALAQALHQFQGTPVD